MHRGRRIVVVTPAGRRRYMELLVPQVLGLRGLVDEYRIWQNTSDEDDIAFFEATAAANPGFATVDRLPEGTPVDGNWTIRHFFAGCVDPGTVYVRLDDDIVWLDDADAFRAFLDFRIDHPEFFLVYATVLNNAVVSHLQQRMMRLQLEGPPAGYACMDPVGWESPAFAEQVHRAVLAADDLRGFRMPPWRLHYHERVSINVISWLGEDFAAFGGAVGRDEEQWLSVDKPREAGRHNCIFGGFVVVHYAFYTQRAHLDATDVLAAYEAKVLCKKKSASTV